MTALALALVLISAIMHATWNLLAKRAGGSGSRAFVWLITALTVLIYAPPALGFLLLSGWRAEPLALLFIAGSAVLHVAYFLLLQRGYRSGDLSVVYPLARGTGPLLSMVAAVALLAERPTPLAISGGLLIGCGAFIIAGGPGALRQRRASPAVLYALLTGGAIACYTIWDKVAVSQLLIPPLIYDWLSSIVRCLLLTPLVAGRWDQVRACWQSYRREALAVAVLSPLAYILVLVALVFSPVSLIAPARELSILIAAAMGSRLLAEGHARRRLSAAGLMTLGVICLVLG